MRIGIVSDTHRNTTLFEEVADWLITQQRIVALYHLGDDYDDVAGLYDRGIEIFQVPGIYHEGYRNGTLPAKQIEHVLGLRIVLVHSLEKDVNSKDRESADIFLYGHTHKPEIRLQDGLLFMNPGHLKAETDKHIKASFGLLDIQDRTVNVTIFGLDHTEIETVHLIRSESGLYRS